MRFAWDRRAAEDLGFNSLRIREAEQWQAEYSSQPYRIVVVRNGHIALEWQRGFDPDEKVTTRSVRKSFLSCLLGIAVEEGVIGSVDDCIVNYYPQMMDVPSNRGPKSGRYALPKDRDITFRQLIGNTSGYLKPGEFPGKRFHYQSFGMNILQHAIATAYGLYDSLEPRRLPGVGVLLDERIRDPIGAGWGWEYPNQYRLQADANVGVFGFNLHLLSSGRDMARGGLLWLRDGEWEGKPIVPAEWLREATRTSEMIVANENRSSWKYGLGFWTNDRGEMWSDLPKDSFAAAGGGPHHVWVCRSLDLVVAQVPGNYDEGTDGTDFANGGDVLRRIVHALN